MVDNERVERALAAAWESKGMTLTWKQACDSENPNIMQVRRGLVRQVTAAIAALTPTPDVDVLAEVEAWCDDTERDIEPGDAYQTEVTDELDSQARAHVAQLRAILNPKAGR